MSFPNVLTTKIEYINPMTAAITRKTVNFANILIILFISLSKPIFDINRLD